MNGGFDLDDGGDFDRVAHDLRAAPAALGAAVGKALDEVAPGILDAMRAGGASGAPSRGGLADVLDRAVPSTRRSGTGASTRVELLLRVAEGYDLEAIDRGELHHPTYGRAPWVTQVIASGGFTRPFHDSDDDVAAALRRRVGAVLDEIGA